MRKYLSIIGAIILIAAALFMANKVANRPKKSNEFQSIAKRHHG